MGDNLNLLGALVATQNLTVDDAILLADYLEYAAEIESEPASVMSAVDLALDFFRPSPDEDAATVAEGVAAAHDAATCPDCGGPIDDMDDMDYEHAFALFYTIRNMMAKTYFEIDQEEC